jgi:hypothetical protein
LESSEKCKDGDITIADFGKYNGNISYFSSASSFCHTVQKKAELQKES